MRAWRGFVFVRMAGSLAHLEDVSTASAVRVCSSATMVCNGRQVSIFRHPIKYFIVPFILLFISRFS